MTDGKNDARFEEMMPDEEFVPGPIEDEDSEADDDAAFDDSDDADDDDEDIEKDDDEAPRD